MPDAMAAQNRRRSSRPATDGRPGDNNGGRPDRAKRCFRSVITTSSFFRVLRQPVEFTQYACGDYLARLERAGIQPSMSRAGCPWDNAMAESFMRTLKREEVNGQAYRDRAEAEASIGAFIEGVYNRQRLHSALAYLAPDDFEVNQRPMPRMAPPMIQAEAPAPGSVTTLSL
jgi:hypothetical protein